MYEIGIDMGGTHTAVGLVEGLTLKDRVEFATDTEQGADPYIGELAENISALLGKNRLKMEDISGIGMGVPGSFNAQTGMIEYANNLSFSDVPFRDMLEAKLQKTVLIDNDANLAAWGEYLLSKSSAPSFIMVTLGTGIGCGIVLDGKLYRGVNFAEGEIGHMTIRYDGIDCNCGRKGCFEAYASASALVKRAAEAAEAYPDSLLNDLVEGDVSRMNGRLFFQAVREKDETALAVRDAYARFLAEGLTNLINLLQPVELVIGGGISGAAELFLPQVQERIAQMVYSRASKVQTLLRPARFGNDAGIVGAARLGDM
ncbi:MAG TPA: ROK family protein [Candidatus Eisenbergiella merdipullorum]|uniref:ROK family protein n=1 Tax=Candidatus Eisenbergiella merdipullorum TaxID=2838553 RepID=A0A9D2I848_9FIRM|nr:ROK family protein [Candidatus Eisenbergiella merdipullorum]